MIGYTYLLLNRQLLEVFSVCLQGLQVGDEIVQFGSVSAANFVNMQSIAAVVEHSRGVRLAHRTSVV